MQAYIEINDQDSDESMDTSEDDFYAIKTQIIHSMYVRTADENYITARWCFECQHAVDFFWLSQHAIEKYCKAILLSNKRSVKGHSHGIVALFDSVNEFCCELLSERIEKPERLRILGWRDFTFRETIERISRFGSADGRYLLFGFVLHPQDLHVVDEAVFQLRRLVCDHNEILNIDERDTDQDRKNRQLLLDNPRGRFPGPSNLPLDEALRDPKSPSHHAALNMNFAFAAPQYDHTPLPHISKAEDPVLSHPMFTLLESQDLASVGLGARVANWVLENIPLSKDTRKEIRGAIDKATSGE
jgi:hypothetical protein